MNLKITLIGIVAALVIILVVFELIRRKALKERYALLWLALALILIILSVSGSLLQKIADLLNIYYPPSILFSLAFLFMFAIMIHFSVVLSRHDRGYNKMIQKLSILEEKVQKMNEDKAPEEDSQKDTNIDG